ncbi:hypothetical protein JCM16106_20260 [Hydrogenophilus islandicus]
MHEAIRYNETGRFVDFFDVAGLSKAICALLATPQRASGWGPMRGRLPWCNMT